MIFNFTIYFKVYTLALKIIFYKNNSNFKNNYFLNTFIFEYIFNTKHFNRKEIRNISEIIRSYLFFQKYKIFLKNNYFNLFLFVL